MLDGRLFLPAVGSFLSGSDPRHFCVEQFVADANNASLGVVICNAEAPMMMPGPHMMKPGDMESCWQHFSHIFCLPDLTLHSQGHNDPCDAFKFRLYPAVMSLSCICLALTIAVYSALPELRNLPGKNVVCLSASLLLAFACLSGK